MSHPAISLPKISKKEFWKRLKKKPNENIEIIKAVEKILIKKRGYVFRMPKPKSPVVLLLSGGLDSTAMWAILMKDCNLNVYPLFLQRKKRLLQKISPHSRSVNYYASLFKNKFPNNYRQPYIANFNFPQSKIAQNTLSFSKNNSKFILEHFNPVVDQLIIEPSGLMSVLGFVALDYARSLFAKKGLKINTIFSANMPIDGITVKSQTLTSLRSSMLGMCCSLNDFSLQYTSLALEKELGIFCQKSDLIRWAHQKKIPLEKTKSCDYYRYFHCGECLGCRQRKLEFQQARVIDKTFYWDMFRKKLDKSKNKFYS